MSDADPPASGAVDLADELGVEVTRLARALRQLSPPRWQRPPKDAAAGGGDTLAMVCRQLVLRLARLQQQVGDRPASGEFVEPGEIAAHGLADQLDVVGRDAVAALAATTPDAQLRASASALVADLHALRLAL